MEQTLKNAIAKAKRMMDKMKYSFYDISYSMQYEYYLSDEERETLEDAMKKYNEKHCCNLYKY